MRSLQALSYYHMMAMVLLFNATLEEAIVFLVAIAQVLCLRMDCANLLYYGQEFWFNCN